MGGTKKRPVYKIVVADSRFPRDGRFIEKLGFFNPLLPKEKKERVGLDQERIKYWLGQGAQPTTRVARILGENQIIDMPANGNNPKKAVPKKERNKEGKMLKLKQKKKRKQKHQKLKLHQKHQKLKLHQKHQKLKLHQKHQKRKKNKCLTLEYLHSIQIIFLAI